MQFGLFHTVQWPPGRTQTEVFEESMREAVLADELGFDSVWLTEHHFSRHGLISDSLNVLSHLAARTRQIRLGTAVAVLPFHDPLRLAETAATVDLLSGGRLDLGVGRGYQWGEFNGFGVEMAERADRFDEALDVILRCWTTDEAFDHHGRHWQYRQVDPQPKPVQQPHPPIWVATDSVEGLTRCAERGWGVMLPQGRGLGAVEAQVTRCREALATVGRPYDATKLVLARALYVAESDEAAWGDAGQAYASFLDYATRLAGPVPKDASTFADNPFDTASLADAVVFGSPDACIARVKELQCLGVGRVLFFIRFADLRHEQIVRSLELFAAEVAPAFASA